MPQCNSKKNLQVHHIIPKAYAVGELAWSKRKANNIKNGITVCRDCHDFLHTENIWKSYLTHFQNIIKEV